VPAAVEATIARAPAERAAPGTVLLPLPTRIAIAQLLACIAFLLVYGVLHALHVAGLDPAFMSRLSSIPLFSTFVSSALAASAVGAWAVRSVAHHHWLMVRLPAHLALVILGLAIEIILFP
jgi:hypothetical protein